VRLGIHHDVKLLAVLRPKLGAAKLCRLMLSQGVVLFVVLVIVHCFCYCSLFVIVIVLVTVHCSGHFDIHLLP
jgi:hypothetical protein